MYTSVYIEQFPAPTGQWLRLEAVVTESLKCPFTYVSYTLTKNGQKFESKRMT